MSTEDNSSVVFYDFDKPDGEDALQIQDGVMTTSDRRSLFYAALFGLVMVGGLLIVLQIVVDPTKWLPALIAVAITLTYCIVYRRKATLRFLQLKEALELFVLKPLISLAAMLCAIVFLIFGSRKRLQPMRTLVRVFADSFVAFFTLDIMVGVEFGLPTVIAVLDWCLPNGPVAQRLLCLPLALLAWMSLHLIVIFLAATAVSIVATLLTRWFGPVIDEKAELPPCTQISDLHITADHSAPIEELSRTSEETLQLLREAIQNAPDVVVLTGDITDSGRREEWRAALSVIQAESYGRSKPVLLAPGNHDLFPYMCSFRPKTSVLDIGSRLVRWRKLRFLEASARLCPDLRLADVNKTRLVDLLNRESKKLAAYIASNDGSNFEIDRIWEECFPLFVIVDNQAFVILDTNRPAGHVATAAFGDIAPSVWHRLESLLRYLRSLGNLEIVVLGHHHLFTPLTSRRDWKVKFLEIVGSGDLIQLLSREADFYLHGHRHFPFQFHAGRLKVVSAPSLRDPFEEGHSKNS